MVSERALQQHQDSYSSPWTFTLLPHSYSGLCVLALGLGAMCGFKGGPKVWCRPGGAAGP
jgi:hypothetical protein